MDLMEIRRRMLMGGKKVIDTSPRILQYGVKYRNGNPISWPPIEDSDYCITDKYEYEPQPTKQTLVTNGIGGAMLIFNSTGVYMDYWLWDTNDGYKRTVINANSGMLACNILISELDASYAYLQETGQILFAGKNSIYYGHRNISELS